MPGKIDWHSIGYSQAMKHALAPNTTADAYPHRDKWSEQDERDFLAGYYEARKDMIQGNINPFEAYAVERDTKK